MQIALHKPARTTPAARAEITPSQDPIRVLARRYTVTEATVRQWKSRTAFNDRSPTAQRLQTTLTPAQETLVVYLRKTLSLPLDDRLAVTREFQLRCSSSLPPAVSRSGRDRRLRRHGVGCRRNLLPPVEKAPSKPFKAYAPGFLHRDVTRRATKLTRRATKLTYLPRRQDGTSRRDLFVAIDRATRWLFIAVKPNKTAASAPAFLKALHKACPIKISKRLTDNGKDKVAGSDFGPPRGSRRDEPLGGDEPCTDRPFGNRARAPAGQHEFDQLGHALGMEHRLTPPRSPTPLPGAKGDPPSAGPPGEPQGRGGQTQGMVERFNGRIADILKTHPFDSALNLEQTLHRDVTLYNYHLPQSALGSQTPIQGMKAGYTTHPNLFHRRIYDRPGLDT